MKWDKKTVAAMLACFIFYIGYSQYLSHKYPNYGRRTAENTASTSSAPQTPAGAPAETAAATAPASTAAATDSAAGVAPAVQDPAVPKLSASDLRIENDAVIYQFDQDRSALTSVRLKKYRPHRSSGAGETVELLDSPLVLQGTDNVSNLNERQGFAAERKGSTLTFTRKDGDWLIRQEFTVPEKGYALNVKLDFQNMSDQPRDLTGGLMFQEAIKLSAKASFLAAGPNEHMRSLVHVFDKGITTLDSRKHCEDGEGLAVTARNTPVSFIGVESLYFMKTIRGTSGNLNIDMGKTGPVTQDKCPIALTAYQAIGQVKPQESASLTFEGYFGPKDIETLMAHHENYKKAVDFGIFKILAAPLLTVMRWIYKVTHNYGVAIILLTLVLKILFYPLVRSSAVSMKAMQKFQPEMNRIRERHKGDPQTQQREMMKFMAQHKINPAKGCLPILPQIPVFIAFYNVLSHAIELRHAPFAGWLMDMSSADPYYITPVLWGVFMLIQQKITPNPSMDKTQQRIMMMMPIVFTLMMVSLPAGMMLYMLTNTIISIIQQQWLNKKLDQPAGNVSVVQA